MNLPSTRSTRRKFIRGLSHLVTGSAVHGISGHLVAQQQQTFADRFVSLGQFVASWTEYSIDSTNFTDHGWSAPIGGGTLGTSRGYDFVSKGYSDYWGQGHAGVDYRAAVGSSVFAISEGIVRYTYTDPNPVRGGQTLDRSRVHVEHRSAYGLKILVIYGHVAPHAGIEAGRFVRKGEQLGTITLFGGPPHIHFELSSSMTKTAFGYTKYGDYLPPMAYLVDNPGNLSSTVLQRIKDSSQGFSNTSAHEGAVAIRNLIDSSIIINNSTFESSRSGDNIWHRLHTPISRGEFHKMSAAAAGIVYPLDVFSELASPNNYLRLGELLLVCNSRFRLGVSTAAGTTQAQSALVEAFKSTREFTRRKNGRLSAMQTLNRWLPPSRTDKAVLRSIIDLTPAGEKTYITKADYTEPQLYGYNLPVSRALAAEILNKLMHFRASFASNLSISLLP